MRTPDSRTFWMAGRIRNNKRASVASTTISSTSEKPGRLVIFIPPMSARCASETAMLLFVQQVFKRHYVDWIWNVATNWFVRERKFCSVSISRLRRCGSTQSFRQAIRLSSCARKPQDISNLLKKYRQICQQTLMATKLLQSE